MGKFGIAPKPAGRRFPVPDVRVKPAPVAGVGVKSPMGKKVK